MHRRSLMLCLAALVTMAGTGCRERRVEIKPNEIPRPESTTPTPPPAGSEPTPGRVPPPTSPTTPIPPEPGPSQPRSQIRVRVIHVAEGAPALDIYVRGRREAVVKELAPGTGTTYAPVPVTRINARAAASGTQTAVLGPTDIELAPGRDHTVAITGRASDGTLRLEVHTDR